MNKGSIATSALVILATGGYLGYQQWGPKEKPAKPYAPPSAGTGSAGSGGTTGSDATGSGEQAPGPTRAVKEVEVPDLVGLTPDEAKERLSQAGFAATALTIPPDTICRYDDDTKMVKQGTICAQDRSAGQKIMSNARVKVAIEHDTYEEGGVETGAVWRRMPDLLGKPIDEALQLLQDKGFGRDEFEVEERGGCTKGTICDQNPNPGDRKFLASPGALNVGT